MADICHRLLARGSSAFFAQEGTGVSAVLLFVVITLLQGYHFRTFLKIHQYQ